MINSLSVFKKPFKISNTVTIKEIASPIVTIAPIPAPTQIIMTGPSATFGKLFKTTKYGSDTFDKKGDHHKQIAIAIPNRTPEMKPINVSVNVTPKCSNNPLDDKFKNVLKILEGWLVMKLSIIP